MFRKKEGCLLRAGRPVFVGVLGDSVAFGGHLGGSGVRNHNVFAWPIKLQRELRKLYGSSDIHVLSGAQRASNADFADICWDEIWGEQWSPRPPRLDLAIVDYALTSNMQQQTALLNHIDALQVPSVAIIYCPPPPWQLFLQCGIPASNAGAVPAFNASRRMRIPCHDWIAADSVLPVFHSSESVSTLSPLLRQKAHTLFQATLKHAAQLATMPRNDSLRKAAALAVAYTTMCSPLCSIQELLHPVTQERRQASTLLLSA